MASAVVRGHFEEVPPALVAQQPKRSGSMLAIQSRYKSVFCTLILAACMGATAGGLQGSEVRNVLLIVSDDLKASVLGCYGDPLCQTPHIDRLASRGVVFDRAYCQGTVCQPSRESFMFSRYQGTQGRNLGEQLQRHDWYTARVGKIYHMRVPGDIIAGTNGKDFVSTWTERFNAPGLEAHTPGDYACLNLNVFTRALAGRQSTRMPHRMFVTVQYDGDGSDQPDHKAASQAIELLRTHKERPFFLAVGLVRPHYPMVAPRSYFEAHPWEQVTLPESMEGDLDDIPTLGLGPTLSSQNPIGKYPDNQKRMWSGYYASVSFMDEQVGRLLEELDQLGLRDSTAVIFLSDHGYHLGEHGFWQKADLHEEVIRVPLIVSVPGIEAGRSRSIVELVDVYPTITDLLGVPTPDSVQGRSLQPVLLNKQAHVKPAALSFDRGFSYRTDRWHLMRYNDGTYELYDCNQDPKEFTNLAGDATYAERLQKLDNELTARLEAYGLLPE